MLPDDEPYRLALHLPMDPGIVINREEIAKQVGTETTVKMGSSSFNAIIESAEIGEDGGLDLVLVVTGFARSFGEVVGA